MAKCLETPCAREDESCYPLENRRTEQHCWVPFCCSGRIHPDGIGIAEVSVGVLSSSATSSHPRGRSKQVLVWGSWTSAKTSQPLTHLRVVSTSCFVFHAGACMWNHKEKGNYQHWVLTGSVFAWVLPPGLCCPSRRLPSWALRSVGWDVHLGCVGIELCLLGNLASCVLLGDDQSPVTFQKDNSGHTWLKGMKHSFIFFLPHPWNCVTPYVSSWLVGLG